MKIKNNFQTFKLLITVTKFKFTYSCKLSYYKGKGNNIFDTLVKAIG